MRCAEGSWCLVRLESQSHLSYLLREGSTRLRLSGWELGVLSSASSPRGLQVRGGALNRLLHVIQVEGIVDLATTCFFEKMRHRRICVILLAALLKSRNRFRELSKALQGS